MDENEITNLFISLLPPSGFCANINKINILYGFQLPLCDSGIKQCHVQLIDWNCSKIEILIFYFPKVLPLLNIFYIQ